ncbi:MAG: ribonuclease III [Bacteroidaceae bacterium]|nr:ribonuclease III [Bacteroidaceae bacterium]
MKLPFQSDRELRLLLYEMLGFYPHRIRYYKQALRHKSVATRMHKGVEGHNERLEFLGDAILDAIVGDIVYRHFRDKAEGFLTNTRSKIVQRETLNKLAQEIGLDRLIQSDAHSNAHNNYLGGNAFEALVGAIYLDRGYDACMHFMRDHVMVGIINIDRMASKETNFKSKLIEWSQKNHYTLEFRLVEERLGYGSSPRFVSQVLIENVECGRGEGYSKKESHQDASRSALRTLKQDDSLLSQIAERARTASKPNPVI